MLFASGKPFFVAVMLRHAILNMSGLLAARLALLKANFLGNLIFNKPFISKQLTTGANT